MSRWMGVGDTLFPPEALVADSDVTLRTSGSDDVITRLIALSLRRLTVPARQSARVTDYCRFM